MFACFVRVKRDTPLAYFVKCMKLSRNIGVVLRAVIILNKQLFLKPNRTAYPDLCVVLITELPLPSITCQYSNVCVSKVLLFPVFCRLNRPFCPTSTEFISTYRRTVENVITVFFNWYSNFIRRVFIGELSRAWFKAVVKPTQAFKLRVRSCPINDRGDNFKEAR